MSICSRVYKYQQSVGNNEREQKRAGVVGVREDKKTKNEWLCPESGGEDGGGD